jgi:2-polyprenyl-3-methyl-5-hydroxy-6-metoxy-1,4-benzoquinol methylase
MEINENQLHELLGRGLVDFGATFHAGLVVIGGELGLYKALAAEGPMTSAELAKSTGTAERYVREFLRSQAAGGYVLYDASSDTYSMSAEQAMILADEHSPAFLGGGFETAVASLKAIPKLVEAFKTGNGVGWHEHDKSLFHGVERFFSPTYEAQLVQNWIPSLSGIEEKLKAGGSVADVGCGHGVSTLIMAKAFPNSTFVGYDNHPESIAKASAAAEAAGLSSRVSFKVAGSDDFSGGPFDLITTFDCLHDMGDPQGCATQIWQRLAPGGSWMIVEPFANDTVEENLNPVGRAYYSASTLICTPCSLDQEIGLALGAQAGEATLRGVVTPAGFSSFERVSETPFNIILEARK